MTSFGVFTFFPTTLVASGSNMWSKQRFEVVEEVAKSFESNEHATENYKRKFSTRKASIIQHLY